MFLPFLLWIIYLSMTFSNSIQVVANLMILSFLITNWHLLCVYLYYICYILSIYHNLIIHSSVFGYLSCFQIFAVVNNVMMNISINIFVDSLFSHLEVDVLKGDCWVIWKFILYFWRFINWNVSHSFIQQICIEDSCFIIKA